MQCGSLKIGFFANTIGNTPIPISTFKKVEFSTEDFDHQNNFLHYGGIPTTGTSVFTAPVAGIYHFTAAVKFETANSLESGQIRLMKNSSILTNFENKAGKISGSPTIYYVALNIFGDFHLNANDKVWVEVAQRNLSSNSIGLVNTASQGRFSGVLRFAD